METAQPKLRFDKSYYASNDLAIIIAEIPSAKHSGEIDVMISTDVLSEVYHVKLKETNKGSGIFTKQFQLTSERENIGGLLAANKLPVSTGGQIRALVWHKEQFIETKAFVPAVLPEIFFDDEDYSPFGAMFISIVSPDSNIDPLRADEIEVKVSSSSSDIETFIFKETGPNTGIFEGVVRLTPNPKLYNGNLISKRDDIIKVEFQSNDGSKVNATVPVKYHLAQMVVDRDAYNLSQPIFVVITDPDENRRPDTQDLFEVEAMSTADPFGLHVRMLETGPNTGTFVGEIQTSLERTGSGILKVDPIDTVVIKHIDKTLPAPAALGLDSVETLEHKVIIAKALIGKSPTVIKLKLKPAGKVGPIIVEGDTDKAFLEAIVAKLGNTTLRALGFKQVFAVQFRPDFIVGKLTEEDSYVRLVRDYDRNKTLEDFMKEYGSALTGLLLSRHNRKNDEIYFDDYGSSLKLILTGLPDDEYLEAVGVVHHAMEDYLLKLLAIDENVQAWCGMDLVALKRRAERLRNVLKNERFDGKSKTLFHILTALKDIDYVVAIRTIIDIADQKNVLDVVGDLLFRICEVSSC